MTSLKTIHIGCQSWGYDDWVTKPGDEVIFYPRGTKRDEMLAQYARIFKTIEIDSTAYGLPPVSNFERWYEKTPPGFTFSLKLPKEITHDRSLDSSSLPVLAEFLRRVSHFGEKLGMLLIQLPARFEASRENGVALRNFLSHLPGDFRFAVEFRNEDWFIDWTFDELEKNNVALALVEGPWIRRDVMLRSAERLNRVFAYFRIMGERDLERFDRVYRDRTDVLSLWSDAVEGISATELFIYVDNYFEGHAPATARKLQAMLGVPAVDPRDLAGQGSLF
jgi:uncharacterized protein YecE (DUF72 family)